MHIKGAYLLVMGHIHQCSRSSHEGMSTLNNYYEKNTNINIITDYLDKIFLF